MRISSTFAVCALGMGFALAACGHPPAPSGPSPAPAVAVAPPPAAEEPLTGGSEYEKPRAVAISDLEKSRVAGEREPRLPPHVRDAFFAAGQPQPAFIFTMCLDRQGQPTKIEHVSSSTTGAAMTPELLAHFRTVLGAWRFAPHLENGRPVSVCTAIMFRYHIDGAPLVTRRAVPIVALEKSLIAGEREPRLPPDVRDVFYAAGRRHPAFMFKMCIDDGGIPTEIEQVGRRGQRSSSDIVEPAETSPHLLAHFLGTLGAWRFEPFVIDARPVPVCTVIMFRYAIEPGRRP
jgi:hypothetical protein